jgi:hypothetical protein
MRGLTKDRKKELHNGYVVVYHKKATRIARGLIIIGIEITSRCTSMMSMNSSTQEVVLHV